MPVENIDRCGSCNEPITSDSPSSERRPCPKCGSLSRQISVLVSLASSATMTAEPTVVPYPQTLLTFAESLLASKEPGIAVVVAHMGAEIAVERSFSQAFKKYGLTHLEDPITESFSSYNIAHDRVRRFYTALTGDDINQCRFWSAFKASIDRRNKIVHKGVRCSRAEATESIEAVRQLLEHLGK